MNPVRFQLILLAVYWSAIHAATYYVDYQNGNDTQQGTSETMAWKHAPGVAKSTDAAHTAVLKPGDTVLFKGGVVYREPLEITASGEKGQAIVYKGDGWGTTKAIIDSSDALGTPWTLLQFR